MSRKQCCKGDTSSQWEKAKLLLLPHPHRPLNRQSPNIANVITSSESPHMPHLVTVAPGVTSPQYRKIYHSIFIKFICLYAKSFHGRWNDFCCFKCVIVQYLVTVSNGVWVWWETERGNSALFHLIELSPLQHCPKMRLAKPWISCTVVSVLQRELACDILMTLAIKCIVT